MVNSRGYMIKFENQSNGRYYYLSIEKDLFDDYVLCVLRGGRNHRRNVRQFINLDCKEIDKEIEKLSKRRLQRGYTLITD